MKTTIILICILFLAGCSASYQWTKVNTALAAADFTITGVDYLQTRYIVSHPDKYEETNKILGKHPSYSQVNMYFPAFFLVKQGIALALPNPYRMFWQGAVIGSGGWTIIDNHSIGIGLQF